MYTIEKAKQNIVNKINKAYGKKIADASNLVFPPNSKMGDFAFPCFDLAKQFKSNPAEIAKKLVEKIKPCQTVKKIEVAGPYLNFTLQEKKLAQGVFSEAKNKGYGESKIGKNKKILVEYGTPNTHKAFHIGHLRNIITGEAVSRILKNAGFKVFNVNYQGDVGMHVAKCLWGVLKIPRELEKIGDKNNDEKINFLGKAYVKGSRAYEENEKAKAEIIEINKRIYDADDEIVLKLYKETRKWSLKYFDKIYQRVNTKFDHLYFESETFMPGKKMVMQGVKKGIFKASEGAIIFEGAKHGLHNRVFINSEGYPTYEAKDMALAKIQINEYNPVKIFHVVSKEQTEYFKVIFKAMEFLIPKSKGKQEHLEYGWMSLKNGKMSSRLGNVILGELLLDETKKEIKKIIKNNKEIKDKDELAEKIALAAVKYSILKNGINKDIAFDINESINLSGNSGPYLQYACARIESILRKSAKHINIKTDKHKDVRILEDERQMLFKIGLFPEITKEAAEKLNPSIIAKYLFELAQSFNDYYHETPVLKAKEEEKIFRIILISAVAEVLSKGMDLLGFEKVEKM